MFWGIFGIAAWFAVPAICLWLMIEGLRTGVVRAKAGSYSRLESPVWYWICIGLYGGLTAWMLYLTILFGFDMWAG